jgi:hypothetical protein
MAYTVRPAASSAATGSRLEFVSETRRAGLDVNYDDTPQLLSGCWPCLRSRSTMPAETGSSN